MSFETTKKDMLVDLVTSLASKENLQFGLLWYQLLLLKSFANKSLFAGHMTDVRESVIPIVPIKDSLAYLTMLVHVAPLAVLEDVSTA